MTIRDRRPGRLLKEAILSLGAVVGVLCILMALGSAFFDLRPLIFRSGSMSPTISTGALAIAQNVSAGELKAGDIVMVKTEGGSRVTHRIVTVTHRGERATLALKGDANGSPDAQVYDVGTADRVWFAIPKAGYAVSWFSGPIGLFLLGSYAAFLLMVLFGNRRGPKAPRGGGARKASGSVAALLLVAGTGASGILVSKASPTLAAWTDPVSVTGTTLTADTVPPPATFTCGTLGVLSVRFNWTAVAGATNYTLHYGSGGAQTTTVTGTTATITTAISSGTAWVNANRNYGSTTWTSANSNTRTYTVAVVSLCS